MRLRHFSLVGLVIVLLSIFFRFFHLQDRLYFIYDQGRDALKFQEILQGNLTLVGPTSGLAGFFLGPLWFYAGVPGAILGGGNPYVISAWYIFLSLCAIPGFWLLSKKIFPRPWNAICFALLCLIPGSIHGSTFIWNPLLSIPLMTYSFLFFLDARKSRSALFFAFLFLALTLQSEFAYAIFFIVPLFFLIPWIRQKIQWKDFFISAGAIGITLIPQIAFELKNNFILTKSLLSGVGGTQSSISLLELWKIRPAQLLNSISSLLLGFSEQKNLFIIPFGVILFLALIFMIFKRRPTLHVLLHPVEAVYSKTLLILFTVLPLAGYMAWTGNRGYFFEYYVTPHFIFLTPMIVLCGYFLWNLKITPFFQHLTRFLVGLACFGWIFQTATYVNDFIFRPINNAGLHKLEQAVDQLYTWNKQSSGPTAMLVFTPAYQNEQYDYLISWKAKSKQVSQPPSIRQGNETNWFVLMEKNDSDISKFRFNEWYPLATAGGMLKERKQIGILELEWWQKIEQK